MKEIDEIIETHGGWPDAFVEASSDEGSGTGLGNRSATAIV